jgi:hypothetical protein
MRDKLTWRRCLTCGQLTPVPATAESCWHCGASMAPPTRGDLAGSAAGAGLRPDGEDTTRFRDLGPADDAVAKRLLASVFPDGIDL